VSEGPAQGGKVRVDAWLWAVRLCKTRTQAHDACDAGHVRVRGERAKPSTGVGPGDEVVLRGGPRERIVVVRELLSKRVGAPLAAQAYEDRSPAPPPASPTGTGGGGGFGAGLRDRGAGRPTKSERRAIDKLRGRR
jgi:ribosome-associated heat shock protein Hsp15